MDLIALIAEYGAWSWIIGGMVLLAIELAVPGGVIVWLGAAAIAVGIITLVQPISWPIQWVLYGILSIASLLAWLNYARRKQGEQSDRPFLNQRAARFVGHEAVLKDGIDGGYGRVVLGDTVWRVSGPELPAGTRVRITGFEGAVLTVEAAA